MDKYVIMPAIAIVISQIPIFHLNTLDPSKFQIGTQLKTAK